MSMTMQYVFASIFITLTVVFSSVLIYYKWVFYYWKRKGVIDIAPSIPFGSSSKLMRGKINFGQLLQRIYEEYKPQQLPYVGVYLFTLPTLVIFDLKIIKAILTTDFEHFTDHVIYVNEVHEPLTGHLFALKGQKWRNLRTKLTPTFSSGKMKMMFSTLLACSEGLEELMNDIARQNGPVEIKDVVARFTTDVIGSCAFGIDCNSLKNPNSEFREYGKKIFENSSIQLFFIAFGLLSPRIINIFGLKVFSKYLTNFVMNLVKNAVEFREKNNIIRKDFIHLLIQLKNNITVKPDEVSELLQEPSTNVQSFTIEQMAAQVFVFFVGGFETSSNLLTFCLFELARNQNYQDTLRSEIHTVLQKYHNSITYEAISDMPYMEKCIQETLRKYPPLPLLFRECTKKYTFPNSTLTIEKGTKIFVPLLGIHWDSTYYPDPEKFDPERFSAENKANRDPFAWLPFGEGPRACIGLRFGLMQTKVALITLLNRYKFASNTKTKTPLVMYESKFTIEAKGGIWLDVEKIA